MSVIRSVVTGVGSFLPEQVVTNADLTKIVDTSDEWIIERTGIRQRHKARDDEPTSDLALKAAERALADAGKTAADVDLIIVATTTPDQTFPATAAIVQRKLGAPVGIAFDVQAVCSGFVYAMSVADGFVARGQAKCALVIGAEEMTKLMDWTDRTTCVLFGDGAGAFVLEPGEGQGTKDDRGVLGFALRCEGAKADMLYVDGGPATTGTVGHLRMLGNQVFRHAVVNIAEAITAAAEVAGVDIPEIDWFVPHQANQRIIKGVGDRLGLDEDKVISTVAMHANTSAASIPLAMDVAIKDGRIKKGDLVLVEAMGGGLTWGACAFRF
ncbi:3-oxoacyl-[acyl-carrier-protein] synthase 3 [Brevundimonas diminuta]|uniref:Beta-ketoacyl-[acyl-carrier-protein] synthase III n=2 Tax=Brevundimonas TaxID=41275 RepID=A0A246K8K3_BREDI|nr:MULTISPECIES: beta-ketoacyl-ACP synthase III [Brevundimonas]ASD28199.1 ketoacyl-ACP synthase III [Brevundimonas diminuta]EGF94353.1 3-oxoacyl-acyl-carrier-protein synthase 3 family protein [Brevundimonas diminuta ATCC 11568]MBD3572331.1 ketoacyl-ACP synthase III [Brevundimonas diminuta]MBD3819119.1 ketoacyl-ACP synthase III [Brevundimonas diminuta]MBI2249555.1 ketoacyl-ACP synthase III [Brevundimonas diminuta]